MAVVEAAARMRSRTSRQRLAAGVNHRCFTGHMLLRVQYSPRFNNSPADPFIRNSEVTCGDLYALYARVRRQSRTENGRGAGRG